MDIGTKDNPIANSQPTTVARVLGGQMLAPSGGAGVVWWGESFLVWRGNRWVEVPQERMVNEAIRRVDSWYVRAGDDVKRVKVTSGFAEDAVRCLQAFTEVQHLSLPVDLRGRGLVAPAYTTAFEDVLVSVEGGKITTVVRDEGWLDPMVVPCNWEEEAKCPVWEEMCKQWGDGDPEWTRLLEQASGYMLRSGRERHRWLLKHGKIRSGKGTHDRLMQAMMGVACCSVTPETLAGEHGLGGLLHARAIVVAECNRLDDQRGQRLASVMKTMVGGDLVDVNQKYREIRRNVRLAIMPVLSSQPIPTMPDDGAGLSGKMLALPYTRSFLGKEILDLDQKLKAEMAGIAARFIRASAELEATGKWAVPGGSSELVELYQTQGNVLEQFLNARFFRDEKGWVSSGMIWAEWEDWKKRNGVKHDMARNQLNTQLQTKTTWDVRRVRRGEQGGQGMSGLSIRRTSEE
jgi:putative DNA primase/helicase